MLEAIIAFMPIKEDHVAIGSIDCSKEMRKNFATSSQSFKCDICGNISDILKPRVVGNDKKEEDVKSKQGEDVKEKSDNNNGNKDDKKDSGKDDIKEDINDDNKESNEEIAATLKDIITSFNKDKVSDININDSTDKLNTLDDIISTQHHQPSIQINKNINNNPTIDYFSNNTNQIPTQNTTININTQATTNTSTTTNNTPKPPSQTKPQPTLHEKQHIPPFYDEFLEEFSFYKIQNTIKCHYTKSKEEIDTEIKHLQTHPQPPLKPTQTSHPSPSPTTTPYTSPFKPFPSIETPPNVDPPSDLETKIKQRIYFNKVLTREKYGKIKKEKLRNLNITMMIVMISIILLYYIITKFIY